MNEKLLISGALLVLANNCVSLLKSVPRRLFEVALRNLSVTAEFQEGRAGFAEVTRFLSKQSFAFRPRNFSVSFRYDGDLGRNGYQFYPAPGTTYFWYGGRFCVATRSRRNLEGSAVTASATADDLTLRFFTSDAGLLGRFVDEAEEDSVVRVDPSLRISTPVGTNWDGWLQQRLRSLDTVVLPGGMVEEVRGDIELFFKSREWYHGLGIPFRRGYLFHGAPGGGKTSFIKALASHFNLGVCVVSLNGRGVDDTRLLGLFANVPRNSCVLLEDVDCLVDDREVAGGERSGVTFSGLLNALDGVTSAEGYLLFMTTNHPEKLDPALIRPGRVDCRHHIGDAVPEQAARYFNRFYGPGHGESADEFAAETRRRPVSMAAIQDHLLNYRESAAEAVETFCNE